MRTNQLTTKHLQLLIALQEQPMARLEALAERIGTSRTTVATYLKWLSGENSHKKRYFRVVPDFNEDALGMTTIDVFFKAPEFKSIQDVERMCDEHPYTKYRARCYGGASEIFAQFRIPVGCENTLNEFFAGQKDLGVFQDYTVLPTKSEDTLFTVPRLEFWDLNMQSWVFDWSKWVSDPVSDASKGSSRRGESKIHHLSKEDIYILSILPRGARRKQKEMIIDLAHEGIQLTSQEFSRRLRMLNQHFISRYHVYVDIAAFDLYSNVIITARSDPEFLDDLKGRIRANPIPFRSTMKTSDDFLFWYLRMPSSHLSSLLQYLHPNVHSLEISLVDYANTEVYILWPEAFDESRNAWRTDEGFIKMHTS